MKIKTIIHIPFIFGAILFSINCKNKSKTAADCNICNTSPGHIKKQIFNKKGTLIREQVYYIRDSVLISDGCCKLYYDNGKTKAYCFFKDDLQDSIMYAYYEDGSLFEKWSYFEDAKQGSQYDYDSLTHQISTYEFFFPAGDSAQFGFKYDNRRNVYSLRGKPIVRGINELKNTYRRSDSVEIDYILAIPENLSAELNVKIFNGNVKLLEKKIKDFIDFPKYNIQIYSEIVDCKNMPDVVVAELSLFDTTTHKLVIYGSDTCKIHVK